MNAVVSRFLNRRNKFGGQVAGVSGIFSKKNNSSNNEKVKHMLDTIRHRGTDNTFLHNDQHLSLGMNVLSNKRVNSSDYFFSSKSGMAAVCGYVINIPELKKKLIEKASRQEISGLMEAMFLLDNDEELFEVLREFRGKFVYVQYDQSCDSILVCRDQFEMEPLFYTIRDGDFFFASEVKAIHSVLDLKLNPISVLASLTKASSELTTLNTLFDEVHQVPNGKVLRYSYKNGLIEQTYFDKNSLIDTGFLAENEGRSEKEIIQGTQDLLENKLTRIHETFNDYGVFVSGGVDSSYLAALAVGNHPDTQIYTSNVEGERSELKYAQLLADHLKKDLKVLNYKEGADYINSVVKTIYHMEVPTRYSHAFGKICEFAGGYNENCIVNGDGADVIFAGGTPLMVKKLVKDIIEKPIDMQVKILLKVLPNFLHNHVFVPKRSGIQDMIYNIFFGLELSDKEKSVEKGVAELPPHQQKWYKETLVNFGIYTHMLKLRDDRTSFMHSIEPVIPFMDVDVVHWAINLPVKYKFRRQQKFHDLHHPYFMDKYILRKIAEKVIPHNNAYKPKQAFIAVEEQYDLDLSFFHDGFLCDFLRINNHQLEAVMDGYARSTVKDYAHLEIFGRLFQRRESIEKIQEDYLKGFNRS